MPSVKMTDILMKCLFSLCIGNYVVWYKIIFTWQLAHTILALMLILNAHLYS